MKMYCDILTKNKCERPYYFDGMTIEHTTMGEIEIEFDEYDSSTKDGFTHCYRFKGVSFRTLIGDEEKIEYANGKLDVIKASRLVELVITDVDDNEFFVGKNFTFVNDTILFCDGDEEFELSTDSLASYFKR